MIEITRSQRDPNKKPWWWISGDTRPQKELLKEHGARWSRKRKQWYWIGHNLPEAIQSLADRSPAPSNEIITSEDDHDPCSVEEAAAILNISIKDEASEHPDEVEEDAKPEPVRVLAHEEDETLKATFEQIKAAPPAPVTIKPAITIRHRIPQEACGELTGSITGQVWCYGWATHNSVCIYLNMAGPKMATEAIRARLSKGDIVNLLPEDGPAIELTAGEGKMGMYTDFLQNIPEARFTSRILVHESLMYPNYGGKSTTFIFHLSDAQAMAQLHHHVTELVNVAIFDNWSSYLWTAGQHAKLVRKTRGAGGLTVWAVDLDIDSWTRIVTGGLSENLIKFPETEQKGI